MIERRVELLSITGDGLAWLGIKLFYAVVLSFLGLSGAVAYSLGQFYAINPKLFSMISWSSMTLNLITDIPLIFVSLFIPGCSSILIYRLSKEINSRISSKNIERTKRIASLPILLVSIIILIVVLFYVTKWMIASAGIFLVIFSLILAISTVIGFRGIRSVGRSLAEGVAPKVDSLVAAAVFGGAAPFVLLFIIGLYSVRVQIDAFEHSHQFLRTGTISQPVALLMLTSEGAIIYDGKVAKLVPRTVVWSLEMKTAPRKIDGLDSLAEALKKYE